MCRTHLSADNVSNGVNNSTNMKHIGHVKKVNVIRL